MKKNLCLTRRIGDRLILRLPDSEETIEIELVSILGKGRARLRVTAEENIFIEREERITAAS